MASPIEQEFLSDCLTISVDPKRVKEETLKLRPQAKHRGGDDYPYIEDAETGEIIGRAWTPEDAWKYALIYLRNKNKDGD